jgi:DNA-binding NtrC family response regulator
MAAQRRRFIAVIDDEAELVELFTEALRLSGFQVRGFNESLAALEHLYKYHSDYCLVITDYRMPGLSGFELIKLVSEMDKEIKILLMSAFELEQDHIDEISKNEFLKKPIHMAKLLETINLLVVPRLVFN